MNNTPCLGQTIKGFSGDDFIFLALNGDEVIVRCPVTLKLDFYPRSFFGL